MNEERTIKGTKPCPFCRIGKPYDRNQFANYLSQEWAINCLHCGCTGPWAKSKKEAKNLWNDRTMK